MTGNSTIAAFVVVACIAAIGFRELHDRLRSWEHCGIRVSPAYVRTMRRLVDPDDQTPYRTFVLRPWNPRTWQLWRTAVRIERRVFWEEDGNTPWQLWRAAAKYLLTTALVVGVDQRKVHAPYPVAFGMMRISWGSVFGLITLKALKDPKYWNIRSIRKLLRQNGVPWYAPFWGRAWDITMIAVLKEYEGRSKYTGYVPVTLGLLAQTCQLSEDRRMKWWFTILQKGAFHSIQYLTGDPWQVIEGVGGRWISYFGSKGSNAFLCNFPAWIARLYEEDSKKFDRFFRGGMSKWFRYAERRAPLRKPIGV